MDTKGHAVIHWACTEFCSWHETREAAVKLGMCRIVLKKSAMIYINITVSVCVASCFHVWL